MAGRLVYVWDAKTGALVSKHDDGAMDDPKVRHVLEKRRYNVPPASHLPILFGEPEGAKVCIARWGFPIPQRPNGVFNTRIETAGESPMWRGLLGKSHGAFFVQGYYEWNDKGRREPYFVHRADGEPMLLAAVVGMRAIAGERRQCASIVTCEPSEEMGRIHSRMPVVLESPEALDWLNPQAAGLPRCIEIAGPADAGILAMHEVGPGVNSTKNDRPDLPEPVRKDEGA